MTFYVRLDGTPGVTFEAAALQELRWNGWECPTFTRAQADTIAAWFNRRAHQGYPTIAYDLVADAYTITDADGSTATHVGTVDGTYALGQAAWCWDHYSPHPDLAAAELADAWGTSSILSDIAPLLTCSEAEALAAFLRTQGFEEQAQDLIARHATTDDDPDVDSH